MINIKKAICIFSAVVCIMLPAVTAYASGNNVYADSITAAGNETVNIPVNISGNTGIMGFKITVGYPADVFSVRAVTKGTVTADGMLNDTVSEDNTGTFDVVWSCTENAKKDGSLFVIRLSVLPDAEDGEYTIKMSYSRQDTFDEKWNDVILGLSDIKVTVGSGQGTENSAVTNKNTEKVTVGSVSDVDDVIAAADSDYISEVIGDLLASSGAGSIGELTDDRFEAFVDEFNKSAAVYNIEVDAEKADREFFEKLYDTAVAESFVRDVIGSADTYRIMSIISEAMRSAGVASPDDITQDNADAFADDILGKLKDIGAEYGELPAVTDKVSLIKALYEEAKKTAAGSIDITVAANDDDATDKNTAMYVVIFGIIPIVAVGLIIFICVKRKTGGKKDERKM